MKLMLKIETGLVAVLLAVCFDATHAADVENGKAIYRACLACHAETSDALGPSLKGVFGRKSGAVADYRYSAAMTRANLVWNEVNLKDFIGNPQAKVKGNRMPFGGISVASDVEDLVAYLKVLQ